MLLPRPTGGSSMLNPPQRVERQATDRGYVPIYTTAVVEQPWADSSDTDHRVWSQLFERQHDVLQGRAGEEFLAEQDPLGISTEESGVGKEWFSACGTARRP